VKIVTQTCGSSQNCNSVTGASADFGSVDNKFEEFYLSELDNVRRNTRSINEVSRSNEIEVVDVTEQRLLEYGECPLCINAIDSLGNRHFTGRDVRDRCTPGDSLYFHNGKQELGSAVPDPRAITEAEISHLVEVNENLSGNEKYVLINLLKRYEPFFTSKPGNCKVSEYEFRVTSDKPLVRHSRPIPFKLRPVIRDHINQLLKDDIIEISNSPFMNSLTDVHREGKAPRICVDARKVNDVTIPDRARTPPLNELLQKFHGVKYMTSTDLSSAFLQIPLKEESKPYTAFLFESTVWQYKRTPYGYKNSLSAFIRALQLVLGGDLRRRCPNLFTGLVCDRFNKKALKPFISDEEGT
jgi:hypothetical protein